MSMNQPFVMSLRALSLLTPQSSFILGVWRLQLWDGQLSKKLKLTVNRGLTMFFSGCVKSLRLIVVA